MAYSGGALNIKKLESNTSTAILSNLTIKNNVAISEGGGIYLNNIHTIIKSS